MNRFLWPALAATLAFLCLGWQDFYSEPLELSAYDFRQQVTQIAPRTEVILGSIDEKSEELLGPWPWPRDAHALLVADLFSRGAEAVFLDLMLEEDKPGDRDLAQALKQGFSVIGARLDRVNTDGWELLTLVPPAAALQGSAQLGLLHRLDDQGGGVRFGLLAVSVNSERAAPEPLLAPALELYLHSLGTTSEQIQFFIDGLPVSTALPNLQHMNEGEHPGTLQVGALQIPLVAFVRQKDSAIIFTLPVRYHRGQTGLQNRGSSVVSYVDLPKTVVQERYVIVGENTQSTVDLVSTPVGSMKGMEVHAQTFQSLTDQNYLKLLGWPKWVLLLVAAGFVLVIGFATTARSTLVSLALLGLVYFGLNVLLFRLGWWLPLVAPLLEMVLATIFLLLIRLTLARSAFAEFSAPEAAAHMLISDKGEELEAETVEAVVVVTDIRGYTTLSETRTAVQMLDLLNEYHTATVAVYNKYGGRALTYQGDAQLVVFGYPNRIKDPGAAAIQACVGLQAVCTQLRQSWGVAEETFSVGAAVCTGRVAIGRLGSADSQIQYTVIGDAVRRAHKIQSMSDKLDSPVLVDAETVAIMKDISHLENLGLTDVDGMREPVVLHRPHPS